MPRVLPPLRPKRHDAENVTEELPTSSDSNSLEASVSLVPKPEPDATPPMPSDEFPIAQPMQEQSSYGNTRPEESPHQPYKNAMWLSEIYGQYGTTWLLPPSIDQSSAVAMLLQTEIQAHNITREMLHATEQRRVKLSRILIGCKLMCTTGRLRTKT